MSFKDWQRVVRHKKYVRHYLRDLRWDLINACLSADKLGWNDQTITTIQNQTKLIRKYERRRRLLNL